ncbi:hypothetical protein ILYODFUR_036920 [Ilyodon furcidens]|uniref:Uncharacterized protein n=1 Tax=Ilyodon furcidens TaxID=33524 RepID=A0ABV0VK77_9TELE
MCLTSCFSITVYVSQSVSDSLQVSTAENAEVILGVVEGQGIRGQVEVDDLNSLFLHAVYSLFFFFKRSDFAQNLHPTLFAFEFVFECNPLQSRSDASYQHTSISHFTSAVLRPTPTVIRTTCSPRIQQHEQA